MSLIELLCVMGIIALLAALLLPAVSQANARARRIQCVDHLHQMGIGFGSFANEHNDHFPMAVPASAGGTLELARGGYLIQGDFYFSFRHFQAASNELVTPKLVVCPADTRPPATGFATLSNENLSYFIGVNAEFARPTSILAGDRNLTNDYSAESTLMRLGHGHALRWTEQLHWFKGNLLFADGHVEEKNIPALVSASGQAPATADLALPTLRRDGIVAPSPGSRSFANALGAADVPESLGAHSLPPAANPKTFTGVVWAARSAVAKTPRQVLVMPGGGITAETRAWPKVESRSTNGLAVTTPAKPGAADSTLSPFGVWVAAVGQGLMKKGLWWLHALLLLVGVATLVLRKLARRRNKPAPNLVLDSDRAPR